MAERTNAEKFFERLDRPAIVEAIRQAEEKGFGEIRVHLQHGRTDDPLRDARNAFAKLGMQKTAQHTGCLIFIAPEERAFAVVGDTGIHEKVGDEFWLEARDRAAALFSEGKFTEGIVAAVRLIGAALARHFPKTAGQADTNELPDELSEDEGAPPS